MTFIFMSNIVQKYHSTPLLVKIIVAIAAGTLIDEKRYQHEECAATYRNISRNSSENRLLSFGS